LNFALGGLAANWYWIKLWALLYLWPARKTGMALLWKSLYPIILLSKRGTATLDIAGLKSAFVWRCFLSSCTLCTDCQTRSSWCGEFHSAVEEQRKKPFETSQKKQSCLWQACKTGSCCLGVIIKESSLKSAYQIVKNVHAGKPIKRWFYVAGIIFLIRLWRANNVLDATQIQRAALLIEIAVACAFWFVVFALSGDVLFARCRNRVTFLAQNVIQDPTTSQSRLLLAIDGSLSNAQWTRFGFPANCAMDESLFLKPLIGRVFLLFRDLLHARLL